MTVDGGLGVPPVIGFVVVWLVVGTVITWLFNLIGLKSMKHVGTAYLASLAPALIVFVYMS